MCTKIMAGLTLLLTCAVLACLVQSKGIENDSSTLVVLPPRIRNFIKYPTEGPIGFNFECRIRSLSSRTVNVTQIPFNGDLPHDMILESKSIISLRLSVNDTFKINEILSFGDGEDIADILGTELAFHRVTLNSTYFAFHDSPEFALNPIPEDLLREEEFFQKYQEDTGIAWHHHHNSSTAAESILTSSRAAPTMHMWSASHVGETHEVFTQHGHWTCDGFASQCQNKETLSLTLTAVSTAPRVFIIPDFMNDFECERIIQLGQKGMNVSLTGNGYSSDYRTSTTAWLHRRISPIIDSLYRRAADLLQVDERELARRSEQLQIVNYHFGEEYKSHHDWTRRDGLGPNSRYLTLLLYLTDQIDENAGGETSFPNAKAGPIAIKPVKGTAALFYNLLPDGNGDVDSLHQALPIKKGEKWLSNMWVWDPFFIS